jgi:hypothetical protein
VGDVGIDFAAEPLSKYACGYTGFLVLNRKIIDEETYGSRVRATKDEIGRLEVLEEVLGLEDIFGS